MTMKKRILMSLLCFALVLVLGGGNFLSAFFVKAEAAEAPSIVTSDPLDDLKGATVAGQTFDIMAYGFDKDKSPMVLTIAEYAFAWDSTAECALYVYIYNPQGAYFGQDNSNKIYMRLGEGNDGSFSSYALTFVSRTKGDYGRLFYKYRVELTQDDLAALNSSGRIYNISKVQLFDDNEDGGTLVTIPCGDIYTFTGYMAGYGPEEEAEGTLSCKQDDSDFISLDVQFAYYRPKGPISNEEKRVQDSLHTAYFAVPKRYIDEYGNISAVHAEWYDAVLKPALVTGNKDAFDFFSQVLGQEISSYSKINSDGETNRFFYIGEYKPRVQGSIPSYTTIHSHYVYNITKPDKQAYLDYCDCVDEWTVIPSLYLLFGTDFSANTAKNCHISGEQIEEAVLRQSAILNASGHSSVIPGTSYNYLLFDSVSEKIDRTIYAGDSLCLRDTKYTHNLWSLIFGSDFATVVPDIIEDIPVLYQLSRSDFLGDAEQNASKLLLSTDDYEEVLSYYEKHEEENYIILFRYQVTQYEAEEATLFDLGSKELSYAFSTKVDSNAYFFKETVNLNFNIIDLTFTAYGKDTVVPVVMEPENFFPDASGVPDTTPEPIEWDWLMLLIELAVVAILVGLFVLLWDKCLKPVFKIIWDGIKAVFNILTWPFRWIWEQFNKK